jgi:CRP-like cAMP-binding protein
VIRAALQGSAGFLFSSLSASETDALVMSMAERVLATGETIIKQGDVGDHFYIVESGTFDIYVNENRVASRGPGDSFGELALLYNCPRAATVRATSPARVWALDRITFRYMIASTRDAQLGEIVRGLRAVELLKKLSEEQVNRVADAVQIKTYKKGELIIRKARGG